MNTLRFILLLSFGLVSWSLASNTTYKTDESFSVSQNDTLPGDLFFGGRYLEVEGDINGDIIVGSQKSYITGKVRDDVFAWCEEVRIDGEVGDNLFGFAKEIVIKGKVHGDVIAYGGSVRIMKGAEIFGDLYVGTGYLHIDQAYIYGEVSGGASRINLNGIFDKDIDLSAKEVSFGDNFESAGKVVLTLNEEPDTPFKNAPPDLEIKIDPVKYFFFTFSFYWFLISALVIGAIFIALFRFSHDQIAALGKEKAGVSLAYGALFLVLTPILIVFAVLVLPLAFILAGFYVLILYLSKIFASFILGRILAQQLTPNRQWNPFLTFFAGLLIITLLVKIPYVGFIISLLTLILGSGTFLYYLFTLRKNGATSAA